LKLLSRQYHSKTRIKAAADIGRGFFILSMASPNSAGNSHGKSSRKRNTEAKKGKKKPAMKTQYSLCLMLAQSRWGRVLLHLCAAISRPEHLEWHWKGIQREFLIIR
jgi:hypothetical protein